ncbi:f7d5de01-c513-44cf-87ee-6ccb5fc41147 [Thermothielavioides terrestris]|uniref:F7d5de01-c513-44cf-87ee-6ccb5fc41147 n=1 Tax=Thermothielavioides terrestris TaxID=2587410 RepID=A0A3S4AHK5_9PEZI|nr:f7d5de01-c513-44cf-87ee-6ccb5fc41147 [Thermothielavioides terrestris]
MAHRRLTSAFGSCRRSVLTHAPTTGSPFAVVNRGPGQRKAGNSALSHPCFLFRSITSITLTSTPTAENPSSASLVQRRNIVNHAKGASIMQDKLQSVGFRERLAAAYPWTRAPLIVGAPMRVMAGPELAVAVSRAGGIGFIGPGLKPETTAVDLEAAKDLIAASGIPQLQQPGSVLPVGVGFQIWNGDLDVSAAAVSQHRPAAVWLFAPRNGQPDVDAWTRRLREASPETKVWLQIGTLQEALDAVRSASPPDVLVVQGAEAGGHGRATDGVGFITLLPEIADATRGSGIPLIAAGGVADGRGVVAALGVGAAGVAMGTRFLASREARIKKGYQDEVVRASNGGANTLRTHLYNHLRGTFGWPEQFSPRTIINQSWVEQQAGVPFEELKKRHDEAVGKGDAAWGPQGRTATYAGANVGLIRSVVAAGEIVEATRNEAAEIVRALSGVSD